MHIHILGICGTFMGSLALLARELGYRVTGVDEQVYPPMSTQLEQAGIALYEGYAQHGLDRLAPDVVVVGNALSRGNPAVEYMLDHKLNYQSGPQWIAGQVLPGKQVLAVSGTHGKTTTASMLAWILQCAGLQPGFLIGGVPLDFGQSARLGGGKYFVIEADEYDSAFFDKRSKFIHYRPDTLVINNLEFDHADIFSDLAAIQRQFHHLVRTVPAAGHILLPATPAIQQVIDMGCWSTLDYLSGERSAWRITDISADDSAFTLGYAGERTAPAASATLDWSLSGSHNRQNALAAVAAARLAGVSVADSCAALAKFRSVKRRMERIGCAGQIEVYDDFAHHPTAIALTLEGARRRFAGRRIIAVIEPRSNTMRMGVHNADIVAAVAAADAIWWCADEAEAAAIFNAATIGAPAVRVVEPVEQIVAEVADYASGDDVVVVMSNGGFGGIHQRLLDALSS
ncbi:MAG: UDP-N-acetylmuramate:L-alanyl-gamma-D-glutamyl-meso-diaminopimelate ligase [Pseudomonadales bacterium]|nr:UDP-N-acetylmuramate:L-alanyl-gamma-D-glutamyl-meso-diaminopimelate ligase [Pseudomonadales bacterium]